MSNYTKKNKWSFPLGLVVVLLAVVGIVFLVLLCVNGIKGATQNSKKNQQYEKFLLPIVMNDPDTFDDVTQAKMDQLIDSTIWSLIKKNVETDKYEYDNDKLLIPQSEVEKQFEKLFGKEVKPKHQTIDGSEYQFTYNKAKQAYEIPIFGMETMYSPKILKTQKKSKSVILTVGYLSGSDWKQDERGKMHEPDPSKYVKITMREQGSFYYVSAIQNTDEPK